MIDETAPSNYQTKDFPYPIIDGFLLLIKVDIRVKLFCHFSVKDIELNPAFNELESIFRDSRGVG